jgi:hypothetical protein
MMPEPVILAFAGKKQSGTGTAFRLIKAYNDRAGVPCEEFSFAYKLKEHCRDVLGLTHEQAFGTDAQKNTKVSHLLWENFPVPAWQWPDGKVEVAVKKPWAVRFKNVDFGPPVYVEAKPKTGPMTGREVLQFWGSEITRKLYPNVWADACVRQIKASETYRRGGVCVVTDTRFPNEVDAVDGAGGATIRLTRNPFDDRHVSETSLDPDVFDWGRFYAVIDNATLDVPQTCVALVPHLERLRAIPKLPDFHKTIILAVMGRAA